MYNIICYNIIICDKSVELKVFNCISFNETFKDH